MITLRVEELTKIFYPARGLRKLLMKSPIASEVTAVDKASFQVNRGEVFGLLGPNGAGKTTLIKMLSTLIRPTSGNAAIAGYDLREQETQVRKRIGLVMGDERSFYWRLTGRQNLAFYAALYNIPRKDIGKKVGEVIERTGLEQHADSMVYSYSSGTKQKLAIARGFLSDAELFFLDEPTKSIDVVAAKEFKSFVKNDLVKKGEKTAILATHRLEEADELCDRLAVINRGKIIFCGTPKELKEKVGAGNRYTIVAQGMTLSRCQDIGREMQLKNMAFKNGSDDVAVSLSFDPESKDTVSEVLRKMISKGGVIGSCTLDQLSLEDAFVGLIEENRADDK